MKKIGIDINDVLRGFTPQIEYVYNKYIATEDESKGKLDFEKSPLKTLNLQEELKFSTPEELNRFLYIEAALEIFGHADITEDNVMVHLNQFILDVADFHDSEVVLLSREKGSAIPSTFFFLSKTLCKAETIKFVSKFSDMWEHVDILITANPEVLSSKPEGKTSVKLQLSYNETSEADFTIKSLPELVNDEDLIAKIIKNQIK